MAASSEYRYHWEHIMQSIGKMLSFRRVVDLLNNQLYFSNFVGNLDWLFDAGSGLLSFGDQHRWQTQLLGTESEASGTWLWAWANSGSNIPAHLLVTSLALKAYGEQHGIPELATPQLTLDQIDGHTLAVLASGICEANAYCRCPYEGGALYVLIMDESFPKCPDPPLQRVATVFPQAIGSLAIPDHEQALCGYLDYCDLKHEHTGNQIVVRGEGGEALLTATFDEQKRLTNLEVRLNAEPPAAEPAADAGHSERVESWDDMQLRRLLGG